MDRLVLEAKELLLLASQIGANNFYGIADPFFGMTKDEVWGEIPLLQEQMEEKSLVSFGFDNSVEIREDVQEIISTCANCERYITVDAILNGAMLPRKVLYERGSCLVELTQSADEVSLADVSAEGFIDGVIDALFANCGEGPTADDSVLIPQTALQTAQKNVEEAENILRKNKCPEEMAEVIVRGLNRTGGYCMITAFDLARSSVSDFVCVISETGVVRIEAWPDEEDTWKASWLRKTEISEILHAIILGQARPRGDADEAQ